MKRFVLVFFIIILFRSGVYASQESDNVDSNNKMVDKIKFIKKNIDIAINLGWSLYDTAEILENEFDEAVDQNKGDNLGAIIQNYVEQVSRIHEKFNHSMTKVINLVKYKDVKNREVWEIYGREL